VYHPGDKSVTEALDAYERYLLDDKGNKPGSVEDTLYRLGAFFPDGEVLLRDLSTRTCSGYYESLRTRKSRLGKSFSVDSHRNILAEARSFLRWCSTKEVDLAEPARRGGGRREAEARARRSSGWTRPSEAKLFGHHWRDWVRKWVNRICQAAGVPKVTAHGMRGLHSTLAVENGVSAHVVAASLGHESSATTMQSYVQPEAAAGARQRRVTTVLKGGRLAS